MRVHHGLHNTLLLLALVLLTGCGAVIDQVRTVTDDEVLAALGGEPNILAMDDTADSFGVTSEGVGQIRGNGCLAATAEGLLFVQWAPRKRLWIPRARILKVGGSNAHLGKSTGDALLRVEFRTEAGLVDSAAWLVHDLPTWLAELRPGSDPDPGRT
jgi:hypothetical protein